MSKPKPIICRGRGIGHEILSDLGGPPHCKRFSVIFEINQPVRLRCLCYRGHPVTGGKYTIADAKGVRRIATMLKRYSLTPRK